MKRIAILFALFPITASECRAALTVGAITDATSAVIDLAAPEASIAWSVYSPADGGPLGLPGVLASFGGTEIGPLMPFGGTGNQQDFMNVATNPTTINPIHDGYLVFQNDATATATGMGWSTLITASGAPEVLTFYGGAFQAEGTISIIGSSNDTSFALVDAVSNTDEMRQFQIVFDETFTLEYRLTANNVTPGNGVFPNIGISAITIGIPTAVPEPGSLAFVGSLIGLGFVRRRRKA